MFQNDQCSQLPGSNRLTCVIIKHYPLVKKCIYLRVFIYFFNLVVIEHVNLVPEERAELSCVFILFQLIAGQI